MSSTSHPIDDLVEVQPAQKVEMPDVQSSWNREHVSWVDGYIRWSTGRLESTRIEAREEAGDGLEGTFGSLFGVFDASTTTRHYSLGFLDPKCDSTIGVVISSHRRVLGRLLPCGPCKWIRTEEEYFCDNRHSERPKRTG
jgi:hypothetical protein